MSADPVSAAWPPPRSSWRQRVLLGIVLSILPAYGVWQLFPRFSIYETTALIQIAYTQPRLFPNRPDVVRDPEPPYEWYHRTQTKLVQSELVRLKAVSRPGILSFLSQQGAGADDPQAWLETRLKAVAVPDTMLLEVSVWGLKPEGLDGILNAVVSSYFDEIVNVERNRRVRRLNELERILDEKMEETRVKQTALRKIVEVAGDEAQKSFEFVEKQKEIQHLDAICDRLETEIQDMKVELGAPARILLVHEALPARPAAPRRRLPLALAVGLGAFVLAQIFLPQGRPRSA